MAESNFVDYVKIYCRSGKGGRGSMHLRHVKYNPNGGPDGGDGGHGGSIYLRGNHNYWTLLHLKFQRHVFAEHGGNGGRDKCHGKDGKDIYIDVPCGTVVYNAETGKYVCDVMHDGQEVLLLNELRQFNPDMISKHRVLAVTKCDLLDDELMDMLRETLPDDLPVVFISSVTGLGIQQLKDTLWNELNSESNKLQSITAEDTLVHRDKDMTRFAAEMQAEGEDEIIYIDDEDIEDVDDLDDFEYEEEDYDDAK